MTINQIRQLLYGMFILVLFIIFLYCILINNWLVMNKTYSEQLWYKKHEAVISLDDIEQNPPTLESPDINVTPIPVINWNKMAKSRLPWYFQDGTKVPNNIEPKHKTGPRTSRIWPEEQNNTDRIEEQLMFVPHNYQYENSPMKKILINNSFNGCMINEGQTEFISNDCPVDRCFITKNILEAENMDAIIFNGKYSKPSHNKTSKQVWILLITEPAYKSTLNVDQDVINWTAAYRHDSDIYIPYGRWAYYNPSVTQIEQLDRNYASAKKKKVAIIVSNCSDANKDRVEYVGELKNYITVDVYGECGEFNKTVTLDEFLKILDRDYKFYLAFENANCVDYITDTFFVNGLQYNTLPVVMGGRPEDYQRIAPERSYVHVDDFESPARLAEYLHRLDADDDLYNEYFRWKGTGEFIDTKFYCRLCAMLHDVDAPTKHYRNVDDWWRGPGVCGDRKTEWRRAEGLSAGGRVANDDHE
ncbi:Fucosyltransferase, N-terminal,Glycosyl transferase family 10 [Cinara cedri]|uniref:Fucosyltransferase n=1 Tax=Cinara cedri TaxID=506608 RepID=A0A5E4MCU4_9HEMI|nr:Fucosyltransferase, N-terminal,Glycosyl transferase family 10 [Cinara cedri]